MMRGLLAFIVWWYAFGYVANYASIWHGHAYPATGVQVALRGGEVLRGDLHRDWSGHWVLIQSDGVERQFADQDATSMEFRPRAESLSFTQQWRSWGPVVLCCAVYLLYLLQPLFPRLKAVAEQMTKRYND